MTDPGTETPPTGHAPGLIAWLEETRIHLPLKGVECRFTVRGCLAEVWIDQVYHQDNKVPLDCVYQFPLPADAAVFHCELRVNNGLIQARVEEREEARALAAQHKAAGERTALVEMERENLFTLSLGNTQPGDLVFVGLRFFQPLRRLAGQLTVEIPFCPGVRYIPGQPLLRSNLGGGVADDTDQVPDASRLSPPRMDRLHPDAAYLALEGRIENAAVEPGSVSSPSHELMVLEEGPDLLVTLAPESAVPDRDLVVRWTETTPAELRLRGWQSHVFGEPYVLLELSAPGLAPERDDEPVDFYFLVDRSGSMDGRKWEKAVEALQTCVGTLGKNDRAMITLFESGHQDFAEAPQAPAALLADPNFRTLVRLGTGGGTELGPALQHMLKQVRKHSAGRRANLILITDGQVGNESEIARIASAAPRLPIHCFGIDDALNDAMLIALACQQGGTFHSLKLEDDIVGAVTRLGRSLRQPVLTGIKLSKEWEPGSSAVPDLYAGQVHYLALRADERNPSLVVSGRLSSAEGVRPVKLQTSCRLITARSPYLLWCQQRINQLLAQGHDSQAVKLSKEANLICRLTAFVAWDDLEKVAVATRELVQPSLETSFLALIQGRVSDSGAEQRVSYCERRPTAAYHPSPARLRESAAWDSMSLSEAPRDFVCPNLELALRSALRLSPAQTSEASSLLNNWLLDSSPVEQFAERFKACDKLAATLQPLADERSQVEARLRSLTDALDRLANRPAEVLELLRQTGPDALKAAEAAVQRLREWPGAAEPLCGEIAAAVARLRELQERILAEVLQFVQTHMVGTPDLAEKLRALFAPTPLTGVPGNSTHGGDKSCHAALGE